MQRSKASQSGRTRSSKALVFNNQKGGVGKTTLSLQTGLALAKSGHKVLLIDADPQGSLTHIFTGSNIDFATISTDKLTRTISLLDSKLESIKPLKCSDTLDLISSPTMSSDMYFVAIEENTQIQNFVRNIELISDNYDFILIDTAPGLSPIIYASCILADHVVIPIVPNELCIPALKNTIKTLEALESNLNRVIPRSVVINMLGNKKIQEKKLTKLRESVETNIFMNSMIRNRAAFWYAIENDDHSTSTVDLAKVPGGYLATQELQTFVLELLGRIACGK